MDAQPNQPRLGFRLSGEAVPVRMFVAVAEKLTDLLGELEASLTGSRGLMWQIADLHTGIATLALVPLDQSAADLEGAGQVARAVLDGLALVEDTARRPPHFTDAAVRHAKALAKAGTGEANSVAVFGGNEAQREVRLSTRLVAHADALLGRVSVEVGALEGRIETLTIHDGVAFAIYDAVSGRRIVCRCDRETLDAAMDHFAQRVSVSGEIRFNAQGEAESINVRGVRRLGVGPLPEAEDIRGLFADYKIDIDEWSKFVREKW